MTITATTSPGKLTVETSPLETVEFDLYRGIHKAIRAEMFGVVTQLGRVDADSPTMIEAATNRLHGLVQVLVAHAEKEDTYVQPWIEKLAPAAAAAIEVEHAALDAQLVQIELLADRAISSTADTRALTVHRLYLGTASFAGEYLQHQAYEELEVMPALARMTTVDQLAEIEHAIVSNLTPEEKMFALSVMVPAMNVGERVGLLGGMQQGVPPEVFEQLMGLVEGALDVDEFAQLKACLEIDDLLERA